MPSISRMPKRGHEEVYPRNRIMWEDLPVELIALIQSYLPEPQVSPSSLISKSWLRAFSTSPNLIFHEPNFKTSEEFADSVNNTLVRYRQQNLHIRKLSLCLQFCDSRARRVNGTRINEWLRMANPNGNLKELHVTTRCEPDGEFLSEAPTVVLRLCDVVNMRSIVTIHLYSADIDEEAIRHLLSDNCPLIENISLVYCRGFQHIKASNILSRRLRVFEFAARHNEIVEIDAPSLHSFTYLHGFPPRHLWTFNINSSRNLKILHLRKLGRDDSLLGEVLSKHRFLEHLHLSECEELRGINITCGSLKTLRLTRCPVIAEIKVAFNASRLLRFHWFSRSSMVPDLNFTSAYTEFNIEFRDLQDMSIVAFERLTKVLMKSCESDLIVHMSSHLDWYLNLNLDSFLAVSARAVNLRNLWLEIGSTRNSKCYSVVLDVLFTICRPKHVCALWVPDEGTFFNVLVTELMDRTSTSCWTDSSKDHIDKCWRHNVRIGGMEIRKRIRYGYGDESGWAPLPFHWRDLVNGRQSNIYIERTYDIRFALVWDEKII